MLLVFERPNVKHYKSWLYKLDTSSFVCSSIAEPVPVQALPAPVPDTGSVTPSLLLSSKPSGRAEKMTTKELCEWLKKINVKNDYIELFEQYGINGGALTTFSEEDLKEMGITLGFVRKNIMAQFRQIQ